MSNHASSADVLPAALNSWERSASKIMGVVAVFSVIVNLLMLTLPIYLFQISDRVLAGRSIDTLLMLSLLAFCFLGVLALIDILRRQILSRLATRLEAMVGGPVLASMINSARVGEGGNTHGLRSLQQVRTFISSPVMLLIIDVPLTPIYFAAIFLVHPTVGFVALGAGALLFSIAVLNQKATTAPLTRASVQGALADAVAESLGRNAQVINAMGMLSQGILHWGRQQAQTLTLQNRALSRNFWITGFAKFVRHVTQILVLGCGAYLALAGELTGGMMIAASIIVGRALQPLEGLIEGWRSFAQMCTAYTRVRAEVNSLGNERAKLLLPRPKGQIDVERVLYLPPGSKEPVLNGVSFTLQPGEALAIVGPSGSGKSTLARILVGCLSPTAGKVRLDGTELRNWDRRQFGEFTGYLPQEVELFPGTIAENIYRMREDVPDSAVYDAATFTCSHEMVCQLPTGYETVLQRGGAPLSGGQKQRIALARAFFGGPAFVVLDEPNSNLDAAGEQALTETLIRAKKQGVTVAVVTLRPALLNTVDKVLILRAGRIEAFGSPAEVLHRVVRTSGPEQRPRTPTRSDAGGRATAGGKADAS